MIKTWLIFRIFNINIKHVLIRNDLVPFGYIVDVLISISLEALP